MARSGDRAITREKSSRDGRTDVPADFSVTIHPLLFGGAAACSGTGRQDAAELRMWRSGGIVWQQMARPGRTADAVACHNGPYWHRVAERFGSVQRSGGVAASFDTL